MYAWFITYREKKHTHRGKVQAPSPGFAHHYGEVLPPRQQLSAGWERKWGGGGEEGNTFIFSSDGDVKAERHINAVTLGDSDIWEKKSDKIMHILLPLAHCLVCVCCMYLSPSHRCSVSDASTDTHCQDGAKDNWMWLHMREIEMDWDAAGSISVSDRLCWSYDGPSTLSFSSYFHHNIINLLLGVYTGSLVADREGGWRWRRRRRRRGAKAITGTTCLFAHHAIPTSIPST